MKPNYLLISLLIFFCFLILGCQPIILEDENVTNVSVVAPLAISQTNYTNCHHYVRKGINIAQNIKISFSKLYSAEFIATGETGAGYLGHVTLHIRENEINGTDIVNMTKELIDIPENEWVLWNFEDISINKNSTYYLIFECEDCKILGGGEIPLPSTPRAGNLCFWYTNQDTYQEGVYWYQERSKWKSDNHSDMAFKLYGE